MGSRRGALDPAVLGTPASHIVAPHGADSNPPPSGWARAGRLRALERPAAAATLPSPGLGPRLPAVPDPETLREIARVSGGRAFSAEDDEELSSIYKTLGSQLGTKEEKREVTSAFAIGGLLLLLGAAATSVRWSGRLP